MKKKVIALVLAILLALGSLGALVACQKPGGDVPYTAPKQVKGITTGQQLSGGVTFTNYQVTLTDDSNWAGMSDADKQKIIDYAFNECRRQASESDVRYYNIIGKNESGEFLFMYDRENDMMATYINGQPSSKFSPPAGSE